METWDVLKAVEQHQAEEDKLQWEGTFKDYL